MTDLEQTVAMLDKAKQPHFSYTQVGESGNFTVLIIDDSSDGGRYVPMMYFDVDTKAFVKSGVRWFDP